MKTIILVDQSGKIEQTNKDTVLAFANGHKRAILIPRKLKRKIQEVFRRHGFTNLFIYFLFSVGLYYLLEVLKNRYEVTIDTEYPGKEKIIKDFLRPLLEKNNRAEHNLRFARIGNRPSAHYAAKDVFDRKIKADRVLTLEDFVKALKKTDGRLRECLSTLVDAQTRSYRKNIITKKEKGQVPEKTRLNRCKHLSKRVNFE